MRSIDAADLPPPSTDFAPGPAPMLQWVRVEDLVVDETYQRPIRGAGRKNIAAIAQAFCWSKFAPLIVSPVAGGRFAVIDGQHRATAAALRGLEQLPAQVIIAAREEQAAAFKAVNAQTTRMHALEIHRAGLTAGDPASVSLATACERAGASICRHPRVQSRLKPGETLAIGALRRGLERLGEDDFVLALRLVTAWEGNNRPGVLGNDVVLALFGVVAAHADRTDPERLLATFERIVVIREADKAAAQERPKGVALWELIRDRLLARVDEQLRAVPARAA